MNNINKNDCTEIFKLLNAGWKVLICNYKTILPVGLLPVAILYLAFLLIPLYFEKFDNIFINISLIIAGIVLVFLFVTTSLISILFISKAYLSIYTDGEYRFESVVNDIKQNYQAITKFLFKIFLCAAGLTLLIVALSSLGFYSRLLTSDTDPVAILWGTILAIVAFGLLILILIIGLLFGLFMLCQIISIYNIESNSLMITFQHFFHLLYNLFFHNILFIYGMYYNLLIMGLFLALPFILLKMWISYTSSIEVVAILNNIIKSLYIILGFTAVLTYSVGVNMIYTIKIMNKYEGYDLLLKLNKMKSDTISLQDAN